MGRPLAMLTLAAICAYFIQHKGWRYHYIPILYGTGMLLAILIAQTKPLSCLGKRVGWEVAKNPVICLLILIAGMFWAGLIIKRGAAPLEKNIITELISEYSREGEPVLFLSSVVGPAYPLLVQMNRRPGCRYLFPFWSMALAMGLPPEEAALAEREKTLYLQELAEDIAKIRPRLIFVADKDWNMGCPPKFNIFKYLDNSGFIKTALRDYLLVEDVAQYKVFVLQ